MRKLAAIMFTDIEGFTAIMQKDEAEAVNLLETHTQIYQSAINNFEGQSIKDLGDGTLTIFPSALQAVRCAIELQKAFLKAKIPVRIGIHLGDIIAKKDDIIGDAVNLASRIQTAAISGSVFISDKVANELANHPAITTILLGEKLLKNVQKNIKLYALSANGLVVPRELQTDIYENNKLLEREKRKIFFYAVKRRKTLLFSSTLFFVIILGGFFFKKYAFVAHVAEPEVIAIIPFKSLDKSAQDQSFAEALTQEVISQLSVNGVFRVKKIASGENSVLREGYNKTESQEIGVSGILDGTVVHDNDSLVVIVNLKNPVDDLYTWSRRLPIRYGNLIGMQNELAKRIFSLLAIQYSKAENIYPKQEHVPDSLAAVFYLRGSKLLRERTDSSMQASIGFFAKAAERDPLFAKAYSGIGDGYTLLFDNGFTPYNSGIDSGRRALEKAFLLDSASSEVRASRALFFSCVEGRRADAIQELRIALRLNPNNTSARQWFALELAASGQFDSSLYQIDAALDLEPFNKRLHINKFMILQFSRRYRTLIDLQNQILPLHNDVFLLQRVESFYRLRQSDSALFYARLIYGTATGYTFWEAVIKNDKTKLLAHLDRLKAMASAKNETLDNETLASYYVYLGQFTNAIIALEAAYNNREFSWLRFLNVRPLWDPLREQPRFKSLLRKLGFTNDN